MNKLLLVVIVIVALALPIAASAQEVVPLNYCTTVEAHQEAGLTTYEVNATGSGRWARVVQYPAGSPAVVVAVRDFLVGATVYRFQHLALSASQQYQVQTSHTSATSGFSTTGCVFSVAPLAVVIEAFTATCSGVPYGSEVELRWSVSTELLSTGYIVARNGDVVLNVSAACPGCVAGMSYERSVALPDTHGIYTLMVYNGSELVDVREFWLASCAAPTAVKLAALKAQTEPPIPTDNITLEFLGTLAGAALATWFTVNMFVKSMPNWKAKIVAIPAALFWTVGASVLLAYPNVTAATVFLALANSLLVYFTATGGATMLAARATAPSRAMANGKEPFNQPWW
jgi:hypothetical protein